MSLERRRPPGKFDLAAHTFRGNKRIEEIFTARKPATEALPIRKADSKLTPNFSDDTIFYQEFNKYKTSYGKIRWGKLFEKRELLHEVLIRAGQELGKSAS